MMHPFGNLDLIEESEARSRSSFPLSDVYRGATAGRIDPAAITKPRTATQVSCHSEEHSDEESAFLFPAIPCFLERQALGIHHD